MAKSKKLRSSIPTKLSTPVILVLVTVLLIAQGAFDVMMFRKLTHNDDGRVVQLITEAVDDLSLPLPIDAQSGKAYISSLRLQLPQQTNDTDGVRYRYNSASETYPAEINFTSNSLLGQAKAKLLSAQKVGPYNYSSDLKEVFSEVPTLQACSRGIHLTIGTLPEIGPELQDLGSKKLNDGRTVHFYKETGCKGDLGQLALYIKQIDSY